MSFIGKCRFIKDRVPKCRHIQVQRQIVGNLQRTTTRLSEKKMPEFNLEDLSRNNVNTIKGLLVFSALHEVDCIDAQPLIVFGKPMIGGHKADFQHMDIALSLGLTEGVRVPKEKVRLIGKEWDRRLLPGVYGFSISPIVFSATFGLGGSRVEFPFSGERFCQVVIDEHKSPGLVDKVNGEVDLRKLRYIEEPTAMRFWEKSVYAFLFRAAPDKDREVWAVCASSGAGGLIPKETLPIFLDALARHVAPDFKVFQFLSLGGIFFRNIINVSWARAKRPNCLEWPRPIRLLHGPAPNDWWGDRV